MDKYIDLNNIWEKVYTNVNSTGISVDDFITYIEDNNWFDIEPVIKHQDEHDIVLIPSEKVEEIIKNSTIFLKRKFGDKKEQVEELLDMLNGKLPKTAGYFKKDSRENHLKYQQRIHILDFIITYINDEIYTINSQNMEHILMIFTNEKSKATGCIFADFLNWLTEQRITKYKKICIMRGSRDGLSHRKYAYGFDMYMRLFYLLFSENSLEENRLYEMIADNEKSAVALLFLSLHMICALRDEDIKCLPHPKLMDKPDKVLDSIRNNNISDEDALISVEKILREIDMLQPKPNKTSRYNNIPYIKLFIPESIKVHFGKLFSAAEAHFMKSEQKRAYYIYPVKSYEEFDEYLWEDIAEIFWEEDYSTRRMNKTYMQFIQNYVDYDLNNSATIGEHPIGYMFASFARSHKVSYAEFSKMTAVYLQDQSVSGHSMEYIARQLEERGVCSFVVSEMLEMTYGAEYKKLTMSEQTKIIEELGLNSYEIENTIITYENSLNNAVKVAEEIMTIPEEKRKILVNIALSNIALGTAVSKNKDVMCVMTAMGKDCPYKDRGNCIGCEYEILTKSTMYTLSAEFNRNRKLLGKTENPMLKQKYKTILIKSILPAMNEIFTWIKEKKGTDKVLELEKVVREVTKNG